MTLHPPTHQQQPVPGSHGATLLLLHSCQLLQPDAICMQPLQQCLMKQHICAMLLCIGCSVWLTISPSRAD